MTVLALLWAKVWKYIVALGVLLAAVAAVFLKGRSAGKKADEAKVENAVVQTEVAQANTAQVESRHETDVIVQNLPEAPAQTVATADPSTAAGKLRDDGFTRD
jgi:hypothetical protein